MDVRHEVGSIARKSIAILVQFECDIACRLLYDVGQQRRDLVGRSGSELSALGRRLTGLVKVVDLSEVTDKKLHFHHSVPVARLRSVDNGPEIISRDLCAEESFGGVVTLRPTSDVLETFERVVSETDFGILSEDFLTFDVETPSDD